MVDNEAEVIVTTNVAEHTHEPLDDDELSLAELVRRQGVRPVRNVHDMARSHVFESDDELEAFLAHVAASRTPIWRSPWPASSSTSTFPQASEAVDGGRLSDPDDGIDKRQGPRRSFCQTVVVALPWRVGREVSTRCRRWR